jgi:hypothetical protein
MDLKKTNYSMLEMDEFKHPHPPNIQNECEEHLQLVNVITSDNVNVTSGFELEEKLKQEELEELNRLLADIHAIKEINETLAGFLEEHREQIREIEETVVDTNHIIDSTNGDILQAIEIQTSYFYTKSTVVLVIAGVVTLPVSWAFGLKVGAIACVSSLATGSLWAVTK